MRALTTSTDNFFLMSHNVKQCQNGVILENERSNKNKQNNLKQTYINLNINHRSAYNYWNVHTKSVPIGLQPRRCTFIVLLSYYQTLDFYT